MLASVGITGRHFQIVTVATPANRKPTAAHSYLYRLGRRQFFGFQKNNHILGYRHLQASNGADIFWRMPGRNAPPVEKYPLHNRVGKNNRFG